MEQEVQEAERRGIDHQHVLQDQHQQAREWQQQVAEWEHTRDAELFSEQECCRKQKAEAERLRSELAAAGSTHVEQ